SSLIAPINSSSWLCTSTVPLTALRNVVFIPSVVAESSLNFVSKLSGIACATMLSAAFLTELAFPSSPITIPSPVYSPISLNTLDGDFIFSKFLAPFTASPTTTFAEFTKSLEFLLCPVIIPSIKALPALTISLTNPLIALGIDPSLSFTVLTDSVILSLLPFFSFRNVFLAEEIILDAFEINDVSIQDILSTAACLASDILFEILVLISANFCLMVFHICLAKLDMIVFIACHIFDNKSFNISI